MVEWYIMASNGKAGNRNTVNRFYFQDGSHFINFGYDWSYICSNNKTRFLCYVMDNSICYFCICDRMGCILSLGTIITSILYNFRNRYFWVNKHHYVSNK